jgi:hypothetical protein
MPMKDPIFLFMELPSASSAICLDFRCLLDMLEVLEPLLISALS